MGLAPCRCQCHEEQTGPQNKKQIPYPQRSGQHSQAYNGLHSHQSLPSFLGKILPRQVVNIVQNGLVLPLFHAGRHEYRDSLQDHHLPKGEPLCRQGQCTFHPRALSTNHLDYGSSYSSCFCPEFCCSCRSIPPRLLRLTHELFEVFVQIHRFGVVTLHHLPHFYP